MASLDERIAALEEAIALGARRVVTKTAGVTEETEFHSLREMREALAALKAQQANASGRRSRVILAQF